MKILILVTDDELSELLARGVRVRQLEHLVECALAVPLVATSELTGEPEIVSAYCSTQVICV